MKLITVSKRESGQRLDRLLSKYLREAPRSFLYRMMRKKNITLNGKKAQGNETLREGDEIRLFLAEDTLEKFRGSSGTAGSGAPWEGPAPGILYEDDHILLLNKPAGMLSQKSKPQDVSLVEWLQWYLLDSGSITREELEIFRPGVCNRLDRNTSGIVVAGKSLVGLQTMSVLLKERSVRKYYQCVVAGRAEGSRRLKGYLTKDASANQVTVLDSPAEGARMIETEYRPLQTGRDATLLEVHLITGRSHQIRAHLASQGHPILGDGKYGDPEVNARYRRSHNVTCQLLHACRLELPPLEGELAYLSGKIFSADPPPLYRALVK